MSTPINSTPATQQQRLATFNAHHCHAIFPITRSFVQRFGGAFPPVRGMMALDGKAERFDFACTVASLCKSAHDLSALAPMIESFGARLAAHGFTQDHVPAAKAAFLSALREHSGAAWSVELERDWNEVASVFFGCMNLAEARPMRMAA